jgi:hypothetical protein
MEFIINILATLATLFVFSAIIASILLLFIFLVRIAKKRREK